MVEKFSYMDRLIFPQKFEVKGVLVTTSSYEAPKTNDQWVYETHEQHLNRYRGHSSQVVLEVKPVDDICTEKLYFHGFSVARRGDKIIAMIPRFNVEDPGTKCLRKYVDREYWDVEEAIELKIFGDWNDAEPLRTEQSSNYSYYFHG